MAEVDQHEERRGLAMIALLLAFVVGVLFTVVLVLLLASGVVGRALESFTLADDEMGLADDFAHLR